MKYIFSGILLFILAGTCYAQNMDEIKSLEKKLARSRNDSLTHRLYLEIATEYIIHNMDTALYYANQSLSVVEQSKKDLNTIDYDVRKAESYFKLGDIYYANGDNALCIIQYEKGMKLFDKHGFDEEVGKGYFRLGNVHYLEGSLDLGLELLECAKKYHLWILQKYAKV